MIDGSSTRFHLCKPATPVTFYLTSLSDRGLSRSSVLSVAYGIAWLHKGVGCPNPVDDPFVAQNLAGLKCFLAGPSKKERPIECHHVRSLIRSSLVRIVILHNS